MAFPEETMVEAEMSSSSVYSPGLADIALLYDTVSKSIRFVRGLWVAESKVNTDRESVREMAETVVEVDEARFVAAGDAIGERWVGFEAMAAKPSFWRRLDLDLRRAGWVMVKSWVVNERPKVSSCCYCGYKKQAVSIKQGTSGAWWIVNERKEGNKVSLR